MNMLRTLSLSLCAASVVLPASAQEPAANLPKQMRIITASVGGTGPDFIARLIAPKLTETARVNTIVDNRPSVNGIVAAQFTARAAPDGSVIMMGNAGTHAINAALYKKLEYDPLNDFAGITEIASIPLALVIHPVVQALHREITRIVALPDVNERLLNTGHRIVAGTPQQLTDKVRREIDKTRRIMAASGMQQN